ncbi:ABC transporter permease [Rhodocyclus purpureus]|uniref:ABC transporter permease n=1 Tax=Rhodocyclus purpureus TaxID=1067 RepID=UPI001914505D|nr:ABC transporter permease [Rhodocyclus purpureus]MBK5913476.1 multidrug ABC transporter substrate-binding protein [Rhodocyclus purpureus]
MLINALLLALREIRRNLLRSFLTVLGIVIGVAAVITMVTLGNGATQMVSDQISSLGSNLLVLRPGQRMGPGRDTAGSPNFKKSDLEAIRTQVNGLEVVAPVAGSSATLVAGNNNWSATINGTTNDYLFAGNWKIGAGREFQDDEERAGKAVCIIGATVRRELFGSRNPLGDEIRVKTFSCQVVGLLAAKGQGAMGMDQDDIVLMPLATVQRRLTGNPDVPTALISLKDNAEPAAVMAQIRSLLRERRKLAENEADNFTVMDTKQIAETLSGTIRTMTGLLGAVAAVSLLVGGIGIMNIMLVSVTERTREIGIRLAIGALEHEVLLQFLIEAVVLSAFGGLVGMVLAFVACFGLSSLLGMPFLFNPGINLLAFGFSAAIGVIFGFVPARRAAQLDPIVALRHE